MGTTDGRGPQSPSPDVARHSSAGGVEALIGEREEGTPSGRGGGLVPSESCAALEFSSSSPAPTASLTRSEPISAPPAAPAAAAPARTRPDRATPERIRRNRGAPGASPN